MFTTYLEVLREVAKRYQHATELARDEGKCVYGHTRPGSVGCAIGCLFPANIAQLLQNRAEVNDSGVIKSLMADDIARARIKGMFDIDSIGILNLTNLQRMHDRAQNVDDFRRQLAAAIALEEKNS